MKSYHIAVLPGDGIGPEVVSAGLEVLSAVAARLGDVRFTTEELAVGAAEFLRNGDPLPAYPLSVAPYRRSVWEERRGRWTPRS